MGVLIPGGIGTLPIPVFGEALQALRSDATEAVRQFPGFRTSFDGAATLTDLVNDITTFIEKYRHGLNTSDRTIKAALTTLRTVRRSAMDLLVQIEREYASATQK